MYNTNYGSGKSITIPTASFGGGSGLSGFLGPGYTRAILEFTGYSASNDNGNDTSIFFYLNGITNTAVYNSTYSMVLNSTSYSVTTSTNYCGAISKYSNPFSITFEISKVRTNYWKVTYRGDSADFYNNQSSANSCLFYGTAYVYDSTDSQYLSSFQIYTSPQTAGYYGWDEMYVIGKKVINVIGF